MLITDNPPGPAAEAASWARWNGPVRFVRSTASNCAGVSRNGPSALSVPALFTSTSTRPLPATTVSISAARSTSTDTSQPTDRSRSSVAARASSRSTRRAAIHTVAPAAASTRAKR
jgi:hypothetical protein